MPRRPSIRNWMEEYNRLARVATERGLGVRELANLRSSNDEARARVESLAARLGLPVQIGVNAGRIPDPATIVHTRPIPRIRTLRQRRRVLSNYVSTYTPPATLQLDYPANLTFEDMTFGIEIECLVPTNLTNAQIAEKLTQAGLTTYPESYNHLRRDHWKIVSDGSVHSTLPNYRGQFELVAPPLQGRELEAKIRIACDVLHQIGAQINKHCGLHVHIGIAPSIDNAPFFQRIVNLYFTHDAHFNAVMAPSRRNIATNVYAKPISAVQKQRVDQCITVRDILNMAHGYDRFVKLNLASYARHHTVEFRQHQGTVEADKIINWARVCARLVIGAAKGVQAVPVVTFTEFLDQIEANESERAYLLSRHARFLSTHASY